MLGCTVPFVLKTSITSAKKHHLMSFAYPVTIGGNKTFVCKRAFGKLHQITNSKIDVITKQISLGISAPKPSGKGRHNNGPTKISDDIFLKNTYGNFQWIVLITLETEIQTETLLGINTICKAKCMTCIE